MCAKRAGWQDTLKEKEWKMQRPPRSVLEDCCTKKTLSTRVLHNMTVELATILLTFAHILSMDNNMFIIVVIITFDMLNECLFLKFIYLKVYLF